MPVPNPDEDLPDSGHVDSMECWCKPDVIFICEWNGAMVIVHKGPGEELPASVHNRLSHRRRDLWQRYTMNKEQFENLQEGDIVQSKLYGVGYIITANHGGGRFTAVRTMDITNPDEWNLVQKPERRLAYQKLFKALKIKNRKEVTMANLSESIRLKCEEVLGVSVVKVKRTDDPNVGLALIGGGVGHWIDLTTWEKTKAGTINGEKIKLVKPVKPVKTKRIAKPKETKAGKKTK